MGLPKLSKERANEILQKQHRLTIKCVSEVINGYQKQTQWYCTICNYEWFSTPHVVLTLKHGCPNCKLLTNQKVDSRLKEQRKQIIRLGSIIDAKTPIQWKCKKCDYIWKTSPNRLLTKHGTNCPKCSKKAILTNQIVDKRISKKKLQVVRLGNIKGTNNKIKWQCLYDKTHTWKTTPKAILISRTGCPHCYFEIGGRGRPTNVYGKSFRSNIEAKVYKYLVDKFGPPAIELQKRYNIKTKHTCDFYIPSLKVWIEVSNYTDYNYLKNIKKKEKWVNNRGEKFYFISSSKELPF